MGGLETILSLYKENAAILPLICKYIPVTLFPTTNAPSNSSQTNSSRCRQNSRRPATLHDVLDHEFGDSLLLGKEKLTPLSLIWVTMEMLRFTASFCLPVESEISGCIWLSVSQTFPDTEHNWSNLNPWKSHVFACIYKPSKFKPRTVSPRGALWFQLVIN